MYSINTQKKDSFEDQLQDEYFITNKKSTNNEYENLYTQYNLLESVFKKVYEISSFKSDMAISNII